MTNSQPDRLERIEALVESNARAIQAQGEQFQEYREEAAIERQELRQAMITTTNLQQELVATQQGIANLLASLDEDRPTILRKLTD